MEIISINELSKRCGIKSDSLRVYLCNYVFNPYITQTKNANNKRCIGIKFSKEFVSTLKIYLEKRKDVVFAKRTVKLLQEYEKYKENLK